VPAHGDTIEREEPFLQAGSKTSKRTGEATPRPAPAATATTDSLRRVAEEVRAAFPRPMRTPELVLIDVDPRHLHAFWSLAADDVERARRELGEGDNAPLVLRILETGGSGASAAPFDVEVLGLQGRCYVDIWGVARGYSGTLGLRGPDGNLRPLAGPAMVRLPNIGPPDQHSARGPVAEAADTAVSPSVSVSAPPPAEPLSHPFPQPPSEPGAYDAVALSAVVSDESPAAPRPDGPSAGERQPGPAAESGVQAAPAAHSSPPEPVSHPFPLPPTEPGDYAPEELIGGFLPADAALVPAGGPPSGTSPDAEPGVGAAGPQGPEDEPAPGQPQALPLENVLTLSSYALGRESVEFEINAELHIFGRARPGTRLQLFGRPVPLRPDGSFSVIRPLPNGALVLSSLLVEGDDEGSD
jgi:hypothetical protein